MNISFIKERQKRLNNWIAYSTHLKNHIEEIYWFIRQIFSFTRFFRWSFTRLPTLYNEKTMFPFPFKLNGKLSSRSYPIQFERIWKHSFLSVSERIWIGGNALKRLVAAIRRSSGCHFRLKMFLKVQHIIFLPDE